MDNPADRLFDSLPAVFRRLDTTDELRHMLQALGTYFLGANTDEASRPGLEQYVERIPLLFAPLGELQGDAPDDRTPEQFVHWLAAWLSFTPHALFPPERLRHIIAGILPLYARRGTRQYLEQLLKLCFADDFASFQVDDRPRGGFIIGECTVGNDTRLVLGRPFTFKVAVHPSVATEQAAADGLEALHQRLRAVIEFAKPAHTVYELEWRTSPHGHRRNHSAARN